MISTDASADKISFFTAREPMWNKNKTRYCTSKASYGGTYRSPEEFSGKPQDESKDTFAFGNNIYTMVSMKDLESHDSTCEFCLRQSNSQTPFI
jgi:hypothetical protein